MHVNAFGKPSINKSSYDIPMFKIKIANGCNSEHNSERNQVDNRGIGLHMIYTINLLIATRDQSVLRRQGNQGN